MEALETALKEIRKNLHLIENEEQVRVQVILRILNALGWDIFSPNEVEFEAAPGQGRADVILRAKLQVVLELKRPAKNSVSETTFRQMDKYVKWNTFQFGYLTDSTILRGYVFESQEKPSFEDYFLSMDLQNDDLRTILDTLSKFLNKESLNDKKSKLVEEARRILETRKKVADANARAEAIKQAFEAVHGKISDVGVKKGWAKEKLCEEFNKRYSRKKLTGSELMSLVAQLIPQKSFSGEFTPPVSNSSVVIENQSEKGGQDRPKESKNQPKTTTALGASYPTGWETETKAAKRFVALVNSIRDTKGPAEFNRIACENASAWLNQEISKLSNANQQSYYEISGTGFYLGKNDGRSPLRIKARKVWQWFGYDVSEFDRLWQLKS